MGGSLPPVASSRSADEEERSGRRSESESEGHDDIEDRRSPPSAVEEFDRLDAPRADRREAAAESGDEHETQVAVEGSSLCEAEECAGETGSDDIHDEDAAWEMSGPYWERPRERVTEDRPHGTRDEYCSHDEGTQAGGHRVSPASVTSVGIGRCAMSEPMRRPAAASPSPPATETSR